MRRETQTGGENVVERLTGSRVFVLSSSCGVASGIEYYSSTPDGRMFAVRPPHTTPLPSVAVGEKSIGPIQARVECHPGQHKTARELRILVGWLHGERNGGALIILMQQKSFERD